MQRISCALKPLKVQSIKVSNMTVPIRQRMTMQIFEAIARCCVCDTFEYKSLYFSDVLFGFGSSRPILSACRLRCDILADDMLHLRYFYLFLSELRWQSF